MFPNCKKTTEPEDTNGEEWIEIQITTNGSNQWYAAIYGNKIIWQDTRNGNDDIYMSVRSI